MSHPSKVDLDKLQKYLDSERLKAKQAEEDTIREAHGRLLEDMELRYLASRKADLERRDAEDPAFQAAKMAYQALGDEWPTFIALVQRASMSKLAVMLSRLERERQAEAEHKAIVDSHHARATAQAAADAQLTRAGERELARVGKLVTAGGAHDAA